MIQKDREGEIYSVLLFTAAKFANSALWNEEKNVFFKKNLVESVAADVEY